MRLDCPPNLTVSELRHRIGAKFQWEAEIIALAMFQSRDDEQSETSFQALADDDPCPTEVFVSWEGALPQPFRRRKKAAEMIEVSFSEMASLGDNADQTGSCNMSVSSDSTVAEVKDKLAQAMNWPPEMRKCVRLVAKMKCGMVTLKEHESIDGRNKLFVAGVSLTAMAPSQDTALKPAKIPTTPPAEVTQSCPATQESQPSDWLCCRGYDIDLPRVAVMDATDLDLVKRRCDLKECAGFSIWEGKAYLKKAGKVLKRSDLAYKGTKDDVVFYLLTREPDGFTVEKARGLQNDLLAIFSKESFQKQMHDLRSKYQGNPKRYPGERLRVLMPAQAQVLPKYGFPGSLEGIMEMVQHFGSPHLQGQEFATRGSTLEDLIR